MEENSVIADETATDSQSDEQTQTETSQENDSSSESSEVTETTEVEVDAKSKANERIREVIKERNEWKEKFLSATQNRPQNDGVAEDSIDPKAFRESIKSEILTESAEKNLNHSDATLAREAIRDFKFMSDPIWQEEAQLYIERGYDPYTAAQMVGNKINYLKGEKGKELVKQAQADKKLKDSAYTPSGTQPNRTEEFTPEAIAAMSDEEYEQNRNKIFKSKGIKI